jgi:folate-binding protein YgfZ
MTPAFPVIGTVQCIAMQGVDARRFAQAQFSGDVDALVPGSWQWNAWLTARGRVCALMHLTDPGDGRLLAVLRGGDAETLRTMLAGYLFRLRATLTVETFTARSGGPVPSGTVEREADSLVLGYGPRSLRLDRLSGSPVDADARDRWRLADIRQGWPNLPAGEPALLPPALGLERLHAVAFGKGCYPGQEIAARLHYRGGHKWRLCRLRGPALLPLGEARDVAGATVAWVLDVVGSGAGVEALATVQLGSSSKINILGSTYAVEPEFDAQPDLNVALP